MSKRISKVPITRSTNLSDKKTGKKKNKRIRAPLIKPSVFVRVRPLAESGGHSNDGPPVFKKLADWRNGSVVLEDRHGESSYNFAQDILDTDAKQVDVYESTAAEVVTKFVQPNGYNVLYFAYGQTGTGKTHTIFGPNHSWDDLKHPDAGIFPRAVTSVLDDLQARSNNSFSLTASAMEFYMCQCTDLLDDNKPCLIDKDDNSPLGLINIPITCPNDAIGFMAQVRSNRTSRETLMNKAGKGHAGSSRSHCAMILTYVIPNYSLFVVIIISIFCYSVCMYMCIHSMQRLGWYS